jgi:uncharacterized delta-60 repeat protein
VGGLLDNVNGIGFQSFDGGLSEFILLAGQKNFSAAIARFNPIGNPDTSFGNDPAGVRIEALGVESTYQAVTVDADNNIIAVGSASQFSASRSAAALAAQPPNDGNFAVIAKYDSIANDDPAVTYLASSQPFDAASFNDVTIDGAGRIVAAGQDSGDFLVARFNAALALDTSFSATGRTNTDFDFGGDTGRVVSIMTDGRIVVAGESNATSEATIPVSARYNGSPSVIVPPNSEGEVSEVELFINYQTLQNPNAQPPLRGYLDNSSGPARLYTLSQPGDDGVARIHLNNDNNNVNIYNVIAGDGSANVAVNVDGLVIYYDVDTTTRIEVLTSGGQDVVTTADNVLIPLLIDGGSGNDQLSGGGADDLIFAGPGNDTATGNSGNDIVIGGDGNDSVQGGAGNNLVIGGKGADSVSGAAGNDIVIAGYTSHDNNIAPLQAILNEWSAGGSVATRANNIRNGLGAANGNKLRVSNGPTVFDDGEKDFLSGASSNDWFFYKKSSDVVNGPSNSVLTDLL